MLLTFNLFLNYKINPVILLPIITTKKQNKNYNQNMLTINLQYKTDN